MRRAAAATCLTRMPSSQSSEKHLRATGPRPANPPHAAKPPAPTSWRVLPPPVRSLREVRGRGLLVGLDFTQASVATEFLMAMLEQHVVTSHSLNTHSVVRLTPPATLDEDDLVWLSTPCDESAVDLARRHPRPASSRHAA